MEDRQNMSAWERWKNLATRAATWQARILLGIFYWIFITPFAIILRLSSDPLQIEPDADGGHWQPCSDSDPWEQY